VVSSILNHRDDIQVVEAAIGALATLSSSPDNVRDFKTLGIVDTIAALHVFSLSEEISLKAPSALKNISLDTDVSDSFGKLQVCSEIESVFHQCEYNAASEGVRGMLLDLTTCISNLMLSCPHNSTHFLSILPRLLELLRDVCEVDPCDEEMIAAICSVLAPLLQSEELSAETIASSHLCESSAAVFTQFKHVPSVSLSVANVMIGLCLKHDFSAALVELGVLSVASGLMTSVDEADAALSATLTQLLQVLSCDSDMRVDIGLRGDSSTVATLLRTHIQSESTTMKNCEALKKLIHKNVEHVDILIEFEICDILLDVMRKHFKNTDILVECLLVMLFMIKNSAMMAAGLEASGGIEVIVGNLRRHTFSVFDSAATLRLTGLALRVVYEFATSAGHRDKFQAAGAPEVITEIFQASINKWDEGLIMWCSSAIYRLCSGSAANQEAFGVSGGCLCVSSVFSKVAELKTETIEAVLLAIIFLSRTNTTDSAVTCENTQNSNAFFNLQCDRNVCRILAEMTALPDVMRVACTAVFVLARDPESVQRMAALGVAELLSDVIIMYSSQDTPDTIDVALVAMSVVEPLLAHPSLLQRFADKAVLSYCMDLLEHQLEHFIPSQLEKVFSIICQFARWKEDLYVPKMMDRDVCDLVIAAYAAQSEEHPGMAVTLSMTIAALALSDDIIVKFV
jgi:hypothetical protein